MSAGPAVVNRLYESPKRVSPIRPAKLLKKAVKRLVPLSLAIFFIPIPLAVYIVCGMADVARNKPFRWSTVNRYFAGNGLCTWLLSPFNLLMDALTLPFSNKGIYQLADLPEDHQDEIKAVLAAAQDSRLMDELARKLDKNQRVMLFFKWYGKNISGTVDMPEFHRPFRYIRTIGVSVFNKKQSTGEHFGPLRVTLRVLYNLKPSTSDNVYIRVGDQVHRWKDNQLFIFDDTLEHQSCNESDEIRYCMFIDILRPSLVPRLMSAILAGVCFLSERFKSLFYKNWSFVR